MGFDGKFAALLNYAHTVIAAKQAGHDVAERLDAALDSIKSHIDMAFTTAESEVQHAGEVYDKAVSAVDNVAELGTPANPQV